MPGVVFGLLIVENDLVSVRQRDVMLTATAVPFEAGEVTAKDCLGMPTANQRVRDERRKHNMTRNKWTKETWPKSDLPGKYVYVTKFLSRSKY
jgi:hypothetical protein